MKDKRREIGRKMRKKKLFTKIAFHSQLKVYFQYYLLTFQWKKKKKHTHKQLKDEKNCKMFEINLDLFVGTFSVSFFYLLNKMIKKNIYGQQIYQSFFSPVHFFCNVLMFI